MENDNLNSDSTISKSKRISMIENSNASYRHNKKEDYLNDDLFNPQESLQFFSSDIEDLLQKWIVVFNYFINK
jgi:hypothetical protein